MTPSLLLLRLRHLLLGLGWPALLGLTLALAALGTDLWVTGALEHELEGLGKKRAELRLQVARASSNEAGGAPMLKLDQLHDKQRIDSLLASVHAAAQKHAIALAQGEYRIQAEPGTRLARYRMVLPAKGSYPQLRAWLDELTAAQPGLQIDELSFKRENITQEGVEARINLSLLVRLS